ncbi:taste receptor type 2 member 20-like [Molossus molossus]|uniref:taste receptor type 2 member 20-like n=1 Tax=Molossus molossus TaxID=27622 RepID=UPI0017478D28|nr:taste receptor type 2 member 20-like [Molossus molossus]
MHIQDQLQIELKVKIVKESRPVISDLAFFLDMINSLWSILSVLIIAEFVLGSFANGFIAVVNCTDWVKRQKLSCADGILTALAVSRIALLSVTVFYWHAYVFILDFYTLKEVTIVYIAWVISNHFSLWLATSLSILYLFKIANFSCLLFLHLKRKVKRAVVMILWGNLVFLVCHLVVLSTDIKMGKIDCEGNITCKTNLEDIVHLTNLTVFTLANFIPFTMSLTAFLLLIFSLWKHLKRMQLSGKGSQDPSSKVHIRAMQTVISFLMLFVIYFTAELITVWSSFTPLKNLVFIPSQFLSVLYPSGHSLILIWGNKKLRLAFLSFLWQLRCWLKERK